MLVNIRTELLQVGSVVQHSSLVCFTGTFHASVELIQSILYINCFSRCLKVGQARRTCHHYLQELLHPVTM